MANKIDFFSMVSESITDNNKHLPIVKKLLYSIARINPMGFIWLYNNSDFGYKIYPIELFDKVLKEFKVPYMEVVENALNGYISTDDKAFAIKAQNNHIQTFENLTEAIIEIVDMTAFASYLIENEDSVEEKMYDLLKDIDDEDL